MKSVICKTYDDVAQKGIIRLFKSYNTKYGDGDSLRDFVYIKDVEGSLEFTGKTDYEINIEGGCTQLDINQWEAKAHVHVADLDSYSFVNKGRKSKIYCLKDGVLSEATEDDRGENMISLSGIGSELIISNSKRG